MVLADDDVLLRESLASLLDRSGFNVVGQAGNGIELLAVVRSVRPELAIIDIRMPIEQVRKHGEFTVFSSAACALISLLIKARVPSEGDI